MNGIGGFFLFASSVAILSRLVALRVHIDHTTRNNLLHARSRIYYARIKGQMDAEHTEERTRKPDPKTFDIVN